MLEVRPISEQDRVWIEALLREHWGSTIQVTRGRLHDASRLPGYVAVYAQERAGLITYRVEGNACEIITLNSLVEGQGIGIALVQAVCEPALEAGCKRLWLITTNDNLTALRFWQKRGFSLVQVYRNAMADSRRLKPEIPLTGEHGIPIRDEIELEMFL
jgi:N-acetylglutamate synthase-like GNAT family acetyltransferase